MLKRSVGDKIFALSLLLPAVITTTLFILVPVVDSIFTSFQDFRMRNIITGTPGVWNDFQNYIRLLESNRLIPAITTTFTFVIFVVVLQFIIGMALALILNSNIKGARLLRSLMMMPWVVPTIVSALIWMWLFQPSFGLIRYFTGAAVLNNPSTAIYGVSTAALWKQIPLSALLLLAGLQNVPDDIIEASKIDGANAVMRFFRIVLPYMKSVIKVAVSLSIIDNFRQFPLMWIMTGGGPMHSTTTLAVLSFREAFVSNNLGSGAAVTTIWMLLMIIVVLVFNRLMRLESMD